ncbi:ABC transporter ATP-binding protein [Paenibacillus sp. 79R4]|uniref:ABC transporter ATP-binding protein n=1 Tax=Paenibacillus sp. 79R4 TaxID=2212847 RepID=UPI0015BC4C65|nr:ABC transporter ATP-binding protein [Paenibacillus sp. 79R4]NWL88532.1 ABC transporter ATP-binding protein [Paenibacillus sp. 79R4]
MSILDITGVSKIYGHLHALQDITFSVGPGEWLSIMGSSGSGKSTMLNMIGLLDKPTSGTIRIEGTDTTSLSARKLTEIRRDKIGLVFQQFHLVPHLTAVENVMVAQYYHSMPDEKEALAALKRVRLEGRARHLPRQLSGGEQQRVCIARALINYPSLILADEPTGNLDEANEKIVLELFRELHQEGHTIIMVTHAPEVGDLAERQIRLAHGKIREIRYPVRNGI